MDTVPNPPRRRASPITTASSSATCTWAATSARRSSSRSSSTWAVEHCRELVINGDIFDDLNFKRLTKRHFACLKVIRRNSDRDDFRLVWVRGNHDGPGRHHQPHRRRRHPGRICLRQSSGPAPDPARRPVRHLHHGLSRADRGGLRRLLLHPEVHAAPRRPVDPPDLEAVAAEQPARREPGDRLRPRPGLPLRHLRPHPPRRWRPSTTASATSTAAPGPTIPPARSWWSRARRSGWSTGRSPRPWRNPLPRKRRRRGPRHCRPRCRRWADPGP